MADERIILKKLRALGDPRARAGMARFGISVRRAYGIRVPILRRVAREMGRSHALAQKLWKSGIHEARHLAAMIGEPAKVTAKEMERWARDFDSWDVVDGACWNLFGSTPHAWKKAAEWSRRKEEYVKRAGFALMAYFAIHDKAAKNARFERLLPLIRRGASDERNFVKKAVNWALRQIGKRNRRLNKLAVKAAKQIRRMKSPAARWIAADALRELTSPAVQRRLRRQKPA